MGNEGLEGLEASVDALHAPTLVAVGNLPPDPPLLVPLGLGGQWNVGKAAGENRSRFRLDVLGVHHQRTLDITCITSLLQTVLRHSGRSP